MANPLTTSTLVPSLSLILAPQPLTVVLSAILNEDILLSENLSIIPPCPDIKASESISSPSLSPLETLTRTHVLLPLGPFQQTLTLTLLDSNSTFDCGVSMWSDGVKKNGNKNKIKNFMIKNLMVKNNTTKIHYKNK
jgi:hypothetical protein